MTFTSHHELKFLTVQIILFLLSTSHSMWLSIGRERKQSNGGIIMTANQIAYWQNVERERANRAQEAENYRSNLAKEGLTSRQLTETERNNLFVNALSKDQLTELSRHNMSEEGLKAVANEITNRLGVANVGMRVAENAANLAEIERKKLADSRNWEIGKVELGRKYADTILSVLNPLSKAAVG